MFWAIPKKSPSPTTFPPLKPAALPQVTANTSLSPPQTQTSPQPRQSFLDKALLALTPREREIIKAHQTARPQGVHAVVEDAYTAALSQKRKCEDKRWRWDFRGRTVVLRDEADKVAALLDRFQSVGDVVANVDPVHVGLPWAGIRIILEAAVSESRQMAALLIGMSMAMYMANRLHVYVLSCQRLPSTLATENFETALVKMYTQELRFLATAIETYQKSTATRIVDLTKLVTAKAAMYNSYVKGDSAQCLEGTRTQLLDQIGAWTEDPASKCIFWLCGMAGTGKSTISRTLSHTLNKDCRLGASFFFKRGERERSNAGLFFPTIASIRTVLILLAQLESIVTFGLRVFVTSRPELPIQLGFRKMSGDLHQDIRLEEVQAATIKHDIDTYLRHRLNEIEQEARSTHLYSSLPADWPGEHNVEALVDLAIPLFIAAFTICRYLSESDPQNRLQTTLQQCGQTSLTGLDKIYLSILDQAVLDSEGRVQEHAIADLLEVVGPVILLADLGH
ncbi:hypothetical protein LTR22_027657 [Elasticomyces elasticus]|nr:hypothetical protein LTR22_027657 [Elasticomyces elasticus]